MGRLRNRLPHGQVHGSRLAAGRQALGNVLSGWNVLRQGREWHALAQATWSGKAGSCAAAGIDAVSSLGTSAQTDGFAVSTGSPVTPMTILSRLATLERLAGGTHAAQGHDLVCGDWLGGYAGPQPRSARN